MANTRAYNRAEEWIRNVLLPREHGQRFHEGKLPLGRGKTELQENTSLMPSPKTEGSSWRSRLTQAVPQAANFLEERSRRRTPTCSSSLWLEPGSGSWC